MQSAWPQRWLLCQASTTKHDTKVLTHLGPPAGAAVIALLDSAGTAAAIARKHMKVLAAARIDGLHVLGVHQAVLRGGPPDR